MLHRALAEVKQGFYIDIGAYHPVNDSISKGFYELGWRGVHVEPVPEHADLFRADRPDETTIQAVVSSQPGTKRLYKYQGTGWSTLQEDLVATVEEQADGNCEMEEIDVDALTLDQLLERTGTQEIHWLKIDVEGHERSVLEGWRDAPARPWVIVIEAIAPFSNEPSYEEWEELLAEKGYKFVYFDGINRFYLSGDHKHLEGRFRYGVCYWDGVQLSPTHSFVHLLVCQHNEQISIAESRRIADVDRVRMEANDQIAIVRNDKLELQASLAEMAQSRDDAQALALALEAEGAGLRADIDRVLAEANDQIAIVRNDKLELQASLAEVTRSCDDALAQALALEVEGAGLRADLDLARAEFARSKDVLSEQLDFAHVRLNQLAEENHQLRRHLMHFASTIETASDAVGWKLASVFSGSVKAVAALPMQDDDWTLKADGEPGEHDLRGLLAIADAEFVQQAYLMILGREPDSSGIRSTLAHLRSGASRFDVVTILRRSPEGAANQAPLPGLDASIKDYLWNRSPTLGSAFRFARRLRGRPRRRTRDELPEQLSTLLSIGDEAFVKAAYRLLLEREADPGGLESALDALRLGACRYEIISRLRQSAEGRAVEPSVVELDRAVSRLKRRAMPLVGSWLRFLDRWCVKNPIVAIEAERAATAYAFADPLSLRSSPDARAPQSEGKDCGDGRAPEGVADDQWGSPIDIDLRYATAPWADVAPETACLELTTAFGDICETVITRASVMRANATFDMSIAGPVEVTEHPQLLFGHSWGETDYPPELIDVYNSSFAGVACTSRHDAELVINAGVARPVASTGLGVDQWERLEADDVWKLTAKPFRFLHVSVCDHASGVADLIAAFCAVFANDDQASLIIKPLGKGPHDALRLALEKVSADDAAPPHIIVLNNEMSVSEIKSLYEQCHVFVAPARSEGFGMAIAQAYLCGLPAIATDWGGHLDYCDEETAWLVDCVFRYAQTSKEVVGSVCAHVKQQALEGALWASYSADPSERWVKAQTGRRRLLTDYSWAAVAGRFSDLTKRVDKTARSAPSSTRIAMMTSWNTRCGIATYSEHLLKGASDVEAYVIASRTSYDIRSLDEANCFRCWSQGKEPGSNDFATALKRIEQLQIDSVIIQFNYGFFNHRDLAGFIKELKRRGKTVIIDLHSTVDPPGMVESHLSVLKDALVLCDRILAHGPADMTRLRAMGLVDNIMHFPHGVLNNPLPPRDPTLAASAPMIASFGFALPNKGLIELIEAVGILRDQGRTVRLRMVNAAHVSSQSRELITSMRAAIKRLKLFKVVKMYTDFLDDNRCLELLGDADLVVNPYQETGESASGSVRYGIAIGRPVAVTPLAIFEDLGDAVFRTPGIAPTDLAAGIGQALDHIAAQSDQAKHVSKFAQKWREAHDYRRQGARLLQLATGLGRG